MNKSITLCINCGGSGSVCLKCKKGGIGCRCLNKNNTTMKNIEALKFKPCPWCDGTGKASCVCATLPHRHDCPHSGRKLNIPLAYSGECK